MSKIDMLGEPIKFIMLKAGGGTPDKQRVIIGETTSYKKIQFTNGNIDDGFKVYEQINIITLGILIEKFDFNPNDKIIVCGEFDSYQIRPKAIYKNNKGQYYYKDNGNVYLNKDQNDRIENIIEIFKKSLKCSCL